MENAGQYTPQPQRDAPEQGQQQYYGWQYEQEPQVPVLSPSSGKPSQSSAYGWQYEQEPAALTDSARPAQTPEIYGWQYEQEAAAPGAPAPVRPAKQSPVPAKQYQQPSPVSSETFTPARLPGNEPQIASNPLLPPVPSQPLAGLPSLPGQSQHRSLRAYGMLSGPLTAYPKQSPEPAPLPKLSQDQQPLLDMGSTLGYSQGMEYQYFNTPQPSQPLPVLREARLQQLRNERMGRQQLNSQADLTNLMLRQGVGPTAKPLSGIFNLFHTSTDRANASPEQETLNSSPASLHNLMQRLSGNPVPSVGQIDEIGVNRNPEGATGKTNIMVSVTMILTGSFILGRVLGLLRNSLFAFIFGTQALSDAYVQAFLVPDLIFNVVAGGALSSAFIPVFTRYILNEKDDKKAWHIASTALNLALAILCLLALLAMILAPWLVPLYNPATEPSKLSLIVTLTRIMLLQSIIMGSGVILSSVLYARQNFKRPAVGTVLYNAGLILGLLPGFVLTFFGRTEAQMSFAIYAATGGVVLGALLQVGILIPGILNEKMHYTLSFDWKHPGIRQIARQMLPRALNAAALYLSTFVDRALLLMLAAGPLLARQNGLVTQYYMAFQLVLLPLGIFGMTVSTAAFPTMAENVASGHLDRVRLLIEDTLRSILFLSIPTSVGLMILGLPVIQVLLQHGAFNLDSSTGTSVPLAFFALGLTGLAAVEILTRSFYSFRDSKTPIIVSTAQFVLKILLSLILLNLFKWGPSWSMGALAFATSLAGSVEAVTMLWLLQRKIGMLQLRKLATFTGRVLLASLAMGAGILLLRTLLDLFLQTTTLEDLGVLGTIFAIFKLVCELSAGLLVYVWATRHLGIEDFWKQGPVRRVLERFKLSWI